LTKYKLIYSVFPKWIVKEFELISIAGSLTIGLPLINTLNRFGFSILLIFTVSIHIRYLPVS